MKKIISVSILVVAITVGYYFASFLPSQKLTQARQAKESFLFNKKTECKNICDDLYLNDKSELPEDSVFNPTYAYNESMNSCFYSGGWLTSDPVALTKRVINCQTNEEILTYMTINNNVFTSFCDSCVSSVQEYDEKEKNLMGK